MDQLADLLTHRLEQPRMAVAQRIHADTRDEIEVALAIRAVHIAALAAF